MDVTHVPMTTRAQHSHASNDSPCCLCSTHPPAPCLPEILSPIPQQDAVSTATVDPLPPRAIRHKQHLFPRPRLRLGHGSLKESKNVFHQLAAANTQRLQLQITAQSPPVPELQCLFLPVTDHSSPERWNIAEVQIHAVDKATRGAHYFPLRQRAITREFVY